MQTIIPTLRISDLGPSQTFYVDGLGFQVDWQWQQSADKPTVLQISCNGQRIYLTQHPECKQGGLVYFYVDDVDLWYSEILKKSIAVDALPEDKPWGNREMQLSDPDKNTIRVCTPLEVLP